MDWIHVATVGLSTGVSGSGSADDVDRIRNVETDGGDRGCSLGVFVDSFKALPKLCMTAHWSRIPISPRTCARELCNNTFFLVC